MSLIGWYVRLPRLYREPVSDAPETSRTRPGAGALRPPYVATTVGTFSLVFIAAFEALAVTTVMPDISRELDGVHLYALAFAAPLASGIVGMVATGAWSDRRGPVPPLLACAVVFSLGLLVCGLAPSMEALVLGRVLQGTGGGGITVALYVVVGQVYPPRLQPSILAGFAAAWVLPSLFGPAIAALIADHFGWQWVFLGTVGLVVVALLLITPALRELWAHPPTPSARPFPVVPLLWAIVAAAAVLALELLGDSGVGLLFAALAGVVALMAVRPLLPARTLALGRGLPSVIATRGALSGGFFCAEAYVPFVLQEQWGFSTAQAGYALAMAGLSWAAASQAQARLADRLSNTRALVLGSGLLTAGSAVVCAVVMIDLSAALLIAGYGVASIGMGLAYPRLTVVMLAHSPEDERGFNSSAISIADSLGAALALSVSGVLFGIATTAHRFDVVFGLSVVITLLGVAAARRTPAPA